MAQLDDSLHRRAHGVWAVVAAFLLAGVAACSWPATNDRSSTVFDRVVFVSDSLGEQSAPYLRPLVGEREFIAQVFGGTAPCDWLGKDLQVTATTVAVISFTGNSSTACMADGADGFLHGQALVDKYRSDVTALVAQVRASGAHVLLVGQPQRLGGADVEVEVAGINELYSGLVQPGAVSFVDAGAAVEDANGGFALRLPCIPGEVQCEAGGSIGVRSADGVHLCSGPPPQPCAVYSSGAFRFAATIAAAVTAL